MCVMCVSCVCVCGENRRFCLISADPAADPAAALPSPPTSLFSPSQKLFEHPMATFKIKLLASYDSEEVQGY